MKKKLGYAILLHLTFCKACTMTFLEVADIFDTICLQWTPYQPRVDSLARTYQNKYMELKPVVQPYIDNILADFEIKKAVHRTFIDEWFEHVRQLNLDLQNLQHSKLNESSEIELKQTRLQIFTSYIHMTNNRLGIPNSDEGYIAYLIRSAVLDWINRSHLSKELL